jgi:hypothetical protein
MMKIIQAYIQQLPVSQGPSSVTHVDHPDLYEHERIAYAMIVSLFAVRILITGF